MTAVLIPTRIGDEHACAVQCAAQYKEQLQVTRWFGADFPSRQTASFRVNQGQPLSWKFTGTHLELQDQYFDVVWLRRPSPPQLPRNVHPDDRVVSDRENLAFFRSIWHVWGQGAKWINPYYAHLLASNKLVQLREANTVGFQVPKTLVSNDPPAIAAFIEENSPSRTVYKGFLPARWNNDDATVRCLETALVTVDGLPDPDTLMLTPGIYQAYVDKLYEVRATFFGAEAVALRIFSQKSNEGKIDWRVIPVDALDAERFTLPARIYQLCRQMMKSLGIVFACFDFIVTPSHEYVFLEVNEMGQFLWKDCVVPGLYILDIFLEFLCRPSEDFAWEPSPRAISYRQMLESDEFQSLYEQDQSIHLRSESP